MANEAVPIESPTKFARYTVADGTGIPLYTLLKLSDAHLAAATSADSDTFAGIAWEEKTASDGVTEITVAKNGVWDLKDSGSGITAGGIVSIGGANEIKQATEAEMVTGDIVGKAEETASNNEVIRVRVGEIV